MVILSVTCLLCIFCLFFFFFFFNDTATTEIYTLFPTRRSFDLGKVENLIEQHEQRIGRVPRGVQILFLDRKSTRLNSSHLLISYAVFCLKKTLPRSRSGARPADAGQALTDRISRLTSWPKMAVSGRFFFLHAAATPVLHALPPLTPFLN